MIKITYICDMEDCCEIWEEPRITLADVGWKKCEREGCSNVKGPTEVDTICPDCDEQYLPGGNYNINKPDECPTCRSSWFRILSEEVLKPARPSEG